MSEIKLFDTWTFQEEVPEPFHQLLKKEGLRMQILLERYAYSEIGGTFILI